MSSSAPVTVAVCAVFQLRAVKVITAGKTVPSEVSSEERSMVTSAAGWLFKVMVKVSVPPASVVTRPEVGLTMIPAACALTGVGLCMGDRTINTTNATDNALVNLLFLFTH